MSSTITSRVALRPQGGIKTPCRTGSIASGLVRQGLYTLNGFVLEPGDRVCDKNATPGQDRGVYVVQTGVWQRASDWNANDDMISGQIIAIDNTLYQITFTGPYDITATVPVFTLLLDAGDGGGGSGGGLLQSDEFTYSGAGPYTLTQTPDGQFLAFYADGMRQRLATTSVATNEVTLIGDFSFAQDLTFDYTYGASEGGEGGGGDDVVWDTIATGVGSSDLQNSDKDAHFTLSDPDSGYGGARIGAIVDTEDAGGQYFEMRIPVDGITGLIELGFSIDDVDGTTELHQNPYLLFLAPGDGTYEVFYPDGLTSVATGVFASPLATIGFAFKAGKFWLLVDGFWYGGGDPEAGTDETAAGLTGTHHPRCYLFQPHTDTNIQSLCSDPSYQPTGFTLLVPT